MTQCSRGVMLRSMRLIKRYPNRKLYDTKEKQYVTLSDIARMIREGHEVQVTDHANGEDLTAITLTQIIFEQEKRQAGFLPRAVLKGLVQAGGKHMSSLRGALALPLGLLQHVDEEIDRRIRLLIRRGALEETEGLRLRELLLESEAGAEKLPETYEEEFERALARIGVPSRSDIQDLDEQLERLLQDIDVLLEHQDAD